MDILISSDAIQNRVRVLGQEIRSSYEGKPLVVVGVLKGSFMFFADLVRSIGTPDLEVDFLSASSYGSSTNSSGEVRLNTDLSKPVEGKHIILVEDIVDTGLTVSYVLSVLNARNPASLAVCSLLHKPSRQKVDVPIDYLGFTIEDKFVVGYGLDFDQKFRALPFIGIYDPKV